MYLSVGRSRFNSFRNQVTDLSLIFPSVSRDNPDTRTREKYTPLPRRCVRKCNCFTIGRDASRLAIYFGRFCFRDRGSTGINPGKEVLVGAGHRIRFISAPNLLPLGRKGGEV